MERDISTRLAVATAVVLLCGLGGSEPAAAQAWTPVQGEGSVTVAYQNTFVKYHLYTTTQLDRGHVQSEALLVDFSYGITDKLAISIGVPYIGAKYTGAYPHPTAIDATHRYNSALQDLRFDVRYNLSRKGLVVTPFVGSVVPSHDYIYWAHSAVGRDLNELQVGAFWAKLLDPLLPGLFVTGRYSYAFVERAVDVSHNRSNLDLELGYFVKPEFRVFGLAAGQLTHGGIDFPPTPAAFAALPLPLRQHHDQIGRDNLLNVGGGAAFSVTPTFDVFGSVIHTVTGRNIHEMEYGATVGVGWSFMTRRTVPHASRSTAAERATGEAHKLLRCICQKGH